MRKEDLINNDQIRLAVYLKISQLRREELSTLTYSHIMKVLFHFKWRTKMPATINRAVNDIMSLNANEVVKVLHALALMEGSSMDINEIERIIGGELHG